MDYPELKKAKGRPRLTDDEKAKRVELLRAAQAVKISRNAVTTHSTARQLSSHGTDTYGYLRQGRFVTKTAQIKLALEDITLEMIEVVAQLARSSDNDFCKLAAANSIIDRHLGKAREQLTVKEERVHSPINAALLTDDHKARIREAIQLVEAAKVPENH